MVLEGVVTNVAAFGAFVDIGVHQDGLVHVSAMSRTFVSDPREVVKPGDVVRVKVLGVDIPRKRISLTLRLDDEAAGHGGGRGGSRRDPAAAGQPERQPAGPPERGERGARGSGRPGRERGRPGQGGGRRTRGRAPRPGSGRARRARGSGRPGQGGADQSGGAMAEALRRAGLVGNQPDGRPGKRP